MFEYTLREADGRRDGMISRGAAITEPDVVLGEELVDLVRQVDAVRPRFARKLFQIVRELAFLREAADAINAAAAQAAGRWPHLLPTDRTLRWQLRTDGFGEPPSRGRVLKFWFGATY